MVISGGVSSSLQRGMRAAIKAALLSGAEHHRVGAALFKGKSLVSIGWNSKKTHPDSLTRYKAHHAEFACLTGLYKTDLATTTIFIARITKGNNIGISKPCDACATLLRTSGIKKVFYTNQKGEIERLR